MTSNPIIETQHGIIRYAEEMAQVLAEAGRASHDALGDPAEVAVRKWSDVILKRALEILRKDRSSAMKLLDAVDIIKGEAQ